jgi:hypothetical protein
VTVELVKNFKDTKTLVKVGEGCWFAWSWGHRFGIGDIIGGESDREVIKAVRTNMTKRLAKIDSRGRLVDPNRPWSLGDGDGRDESFGLAESLYLLRRFHERLVGFFTKIDTEAILKRWTSEVERGLRSGDVPEALFAASCLELAAGDEDIPEPGEQLPDGKGKRQRIPMVRYKRFVNWLQRWFDCDVRGGKGSEVVIHRPGQRLCILARHGQNPEYSSRTIRETLKKLRIDSGDWIKSVYGSVGRNSSERTGLAGSRSNGFAYADVPDCQPDTSSESCHVQTLRH